jgi:hypothetical protein
MSPHNWWRQAVDVQSLGSPKVLSVPKICASPQGVNSNTRNETFRRTEGIRTDLANEQVQKWIKEGIRCR